MVLFQDTCSGNEETDRCNKLFAKKKVKSSKRTTIAFFGKFLCSSSPKEEKIRRRANLFDLSFFEAV